MLKLPKRRTTFRRFVTAMAMTFVPVIVAAATAKIAGEGFSIPRNNYGHSNAPAASASLVIDASTEKVGMIGRVFNKDGTAKTLTKVGFRIGAVTKGGSTDLKVSLQDVSTTTADADGVVDQSVLVGNGNIVANSWIVVTLGASRSVNYGDLLAVVVEYSTFNASDSVIVNSLASVTASTNKGGTYLRLNTGGTWASVNGYANVILGFSDNTWGTLKGSSCYSAINTHTYNSGSTPDEIMLAFQLPYPVTAGGMWAHVDGDGNFDYVLLDAAGAAISNGSGSVDADNREATNGRLYEMPFAAHISLSANTQYYLSIKPTSVTNISVYSADVNEVGYWASQGGGANFYYAQRTDAGAISPTTTRRPFIGLDDVMGFDDAVQTGGAPLIGPGGLLGN